MSHRPSLIADLTVEEILSQAGASEHDVAIFMDALRKDRESNRSK